MPRANSNGIELEYDTFGDPAADPLLLVMGLGSQMILWHEEFCTSLAERGHYVIRFDNRDVGRSTHLDELGQPDIAAILGEVLQGKPAQAPYAIEDMAQDALGLLDALGLERANVCGASMGGMIVQTMALHAPERVKSMVSIMSTPGDRDLPPPRPQALMALMQPPVATLEGVIERSLSIFRAIGSPGFAMDEDMVRDRARMQFERGYNPAGMARQFAAIVTQEGRRERLGGLRLPSLVVHGVEDPLVPVECGKATAEAIPDAELLLVEGMGHDQPREVWPQVIDAISRLSQRANGAA